MRPVRVCLSGFCLKQGIFSWQKFLKQGVELGLMSWTGYEKSDNFCLKQGQGLRGWTAPPHSTIYRVPPSPGTEGNTLWIEWVTTRVHVIYLCKFGRFTQCVFKPNSPRTPSRLSNHPDFVGITPILFENPESWPTCNRDRKNPDFGIRSDIFVQLSHNNITGTQNRVWFTLIWSWWNKNNCQEITYESIVLAMRRPGFCSVGYVGESMICMIAGYVRHRLTFMAW